MSHFHPDIHWLTEYSAGNLPLSQALCVSVHLSFCEHCQADIQQLGNLGATLLSDPNAPAAATVDSVNEQDKAISDELRNRVLDCIDADSTDKALASDHRHHSASHMPAGLSKLVPHGFDQLGWKKLSTSLSVARLAAGDRDREVALHRIKPGGGVANHDHHGREVTVVLEGSFSDQNGLYLPGDFLVKEAGEEHRPIASEDAECICLSVLDAPVKFTGPVTRLINPFLRIYPSGS